MRGLRTEIGAYSCAPHTAAGAWTIAQRNACPCMSHLLAPLLPLNPHQQAMAEAAEQAYQVFGALPRPDRLRNHGGPWRDYELEALLCPLPLREVSARHFYSYFMAPSLDGHSSEEFLYFLPRILDLLARGEVPNFALALALDDLKQCPERMLDATAQDLLNRFTLAYFKNLLGPNEWQARSAQPEDDPLDVLAMTHLAGLPVQPLLDWWAASDDIRSSQHFVQSAYWNWWGPNCSMHAFLEDEPGFLAVLQAWLADAAVRARWRAKLAEPSFQDLACREFGFGPVPVSEMRAVALAELG